MRRFQQGSWKFWDEEEIDSWNARHKNNQRTWLRQSTPYTDNYGNEIGSSNNIFDDIVGWIKDTLWGGGEI